MRRPVASALGVMLVALSGAAQSSALRLELSPPGVLAVASHAEVVLLVHVEPSARGPLLVTPSVDGAAVEVVRGRLFRFDAEDPTADPLRFRIPVAARSVGTAVLLVRVDGHTCEGDVCRPVESETRATIDVR